MADVVVTLPKSFGLGKWLAEGDAPGEPRQPGRFYYWKLGRHAPNIEMGERVYVVHDGRLIGYAPLVALHEENGVIYLVRGGGAAACTINEHVPGFRGYRYRWWDRDNETLVSNERAITYICRETGREVLTDKVISWKDQWELVVFRHRCPECGQEHEIVNPTT